MNPQSIKSFRVYNEDCLRTMGRLEPNSIDTIITDPPYGLKFMGKDWDHGIPGVPFWEAALRVAKPGAMLMAFGGTRTYHRLACAIEDAGWDLRDCVMWVYGSGFPKSHNISKAIDKAAGAEREVVGPNPYNKLRGETTEGVWKKGVETGFGGSSDLTAPATEDAKLWDGWGTALKPAYEPIILAMKPLDGTFAQNALKWGVAGLWIDGGRVEAQDAAWERDNTNGKAEMYEGWGMKPNVKHGNPSGRWPANLIHDGSDEVLAGFPVTKSGALNAGHKQGTGSFGKVGGDTILRNYGNDSGTAARFFRCCPYTEEEMSSRLKYTAKASKRERNEGLEDLPKKRAGEPSGRHDGTLGSVTIGQNTHPTVKPIALLEYLCKLTATPTGGIVFDPFMGSGSTGVACAKVGRRFLGCENDKEHGYFGIALKRIQKAYANTKAKEVCDS
jgi:site-specific DNA-methyltransferase (adenine-specific)